MAIHALEHPKDLHAADNVFDPLSGIRQLPVLLTLFGREERRPRRLVGGDGVRVASPQALIPRIPNQGGVVGKLYSRGTKELQIVHGPRTGSGAQDALRDRANQHLELQGMPLFLAAVPAALLFLGRSHGTSEASTATMLYTVCVSWNTRFLGIWNCALAISAASTRSTVRCTVASWTP